MISNKVKLGKEIESSQIADIVYTANEFQSSVRLEADNMHFNAKSLMGLFALCLEPDMSVTIIADGEDEKAAVDAMTKILDMKVGKL